MFKTGDRVYIINEREQGVLTITYNFNDELFELEHGPRFEAKDLMPEKHICTHSDSCYCRGGTKNWDEYFS